MGALCGATVAVTAAPDVRLKRIMARDGLTEEQARARIDAQKSEAWYRENCTFLLENQEEDREACRVLMRGFFQNILELIEEGDDRNGSERVERETSH